MKITPVKAMCVDNERGTVVFVVQDPVNNDWLLLYTDDETPNAPTKEATLRYASTYLNSGPRKKRNDQ